MIWFTADEHFFHKNVIRLCNRPFKDLDEMHETLIRNHNEVVAPGDTVIHAGDFAFGKGKRVLEIIEKLNGSHIFLQGNHDKWQRSEGRSIRLQDRWEMMIEDRFVVVDHFPLRSWSRSCHGSLQLHGHCHGKMDPLMNQHDVGVDCDRWFPKFYPRSFAQLKQKFDEADAARKLLRLGAERWDAKIDLMES